MPDVHAKLSASGAKRWMSCTPSAQLETQFKDEGSSYASEGTFAHELAELLINYNLRNIKKSAFEKKLEILKGNEFFSEELHDYIADYARTVYEFVNEARAVCSDAAVFTEQHLDFSKYVPEGFGTGDVVIIADGELHVIDLKYGKGVGVSAEENPQLRMYGLGAVSNFGMLYDIERVRMTIIQPRLDNTTSETLSVEALEKWGNDVVKPLAALAIDGKGEFKPGDHCRFCKARKTCRARAEENLKLAAYEFKEAPTLSDEEIAEILGAAEKLSAWVLDIQEYVLAQALDGKKFPGWKLVEGRSNRKYLDEIKVAEALIAAGFDEAVLYEKKLYGITAMEKITGKKVFADALKDLIIKPQGKPVLVAESDRRPEINSTESAKNDFKEND